MAVETATTRVGARRDGLVGIRWVLVGGIVPGVVLWRRTPRT